MNECSPALIAAIGDYSLLLNRGYPITATIKLVGDRYRLDRSERLILFRGVLDDTSSAVIRKKTLVTLPPESDIGIDGYNVLFTLINFKRGHPLFIGTDGLLRDAGGAHGRFEREEDFAIAAELLCRHLVRLRPSSIRIYLDAPVSHSGQHRELLEATCSRFNLAATTETVQNADLPVQEYTGTAITSSDSTVALKSRSPIFDLARDILEQEYEKHFIVISQNIKG
jgi:hypothetical protein